MNPFTRLHRPLTLARRRINLAGIRLLNSRALMEARAALMPFRTREVVRAAMLKPLEMTDLALLGTEHPRLEIEMTSGLREIVARGAQAYQLHAELHSRVAWYALQPLLPPSTCAPRGPQGPLILAGSRRQTRRTPSPLPGVGCRDPEPAPVSHWRVQQR